MKLIYLGTLVAILGTFSFVHGDKVSYSVSSHSIMAIIGEPCSANIDCTPPNSICRVDNLICDCQIGFVSSSDKSRCLPINSVPIKGDCDVSEQCMDFGNSECTNSGTCECKDGYIQDTALERCLKRADGIGDPCEESQQCQLGKPGLLSSCEPNPSNPTGGKTCQCTSAAIGDPTGEVCLRRATMIGDACQYEIQCTASLGSSHCNQNTCQCLPNAVPTPGNLMCLPKVWLNAPCQQSLECNHVGSADCHPVNTSDPAAGRVCRCNPGYINPPFSDRICYQNATAINGSCQHQVQCDNLDGSVCTDGRCQCEGGFTASANRTRCLAYPRNLNDTCEESVQCQVSFSECRANQCQCRENEYVESQNQNTINTCIPVARYLNQQCQEELQCVAGLGNNTNCISNLCQCRAGFGDYEQRCYNPSRLEQVCQQHEQCFVGVNALAMCALVNATTGLRLCRCQPGALQFDGKCYAPKVVGDRCQSHLECSVGIRGEVECDGVSSQCACKVGYSPTEVNVCSGASAGALGLHLYSFSLALIMLTVRHFLL